MSDMSDQPLSQLALSLMDADTQQELTGRRAADVAHVHDHAHQHSCNSYSWWAFLFFFLIAAIVFYFLYFCLRPNFVLKNNCHSRSSDSNDGWENREIDQNKLLGAALLSSIALIVVLWLISVAYYWN